MPKIVAYVPETTPVHGFTVDYLPDGWELDRVDPNVGGMEALNKTVVDADYLMIYSGRIDATTLHAGPKLKLVHLLSAGFDAFPLVEAGELGIPVCNASGTNAQGVAEMVLTLMLGLYRHLTWVNEELRDGGWKLKRADGNDSYEIQDKTVGIIGLGNIGQITARIIQGFNPNIIYTDIEAKPEAEKEFGARRVDLDELLSESDIITIHTPLDDGTRGIIGAAELAAMKPTAILINTCRGPVIDETALHDALKNNVIWGAGLDVFEEEPTPDDNPIRKLDNVVMAPHIAGQTAESYPRRTHYAIDNFVRVSKGETPTNLITPA